MTALPGPLLAVTCPVCGVASVLDHDAMVTALPDLVANLDREDRFARERRKRDAMRVANAALLRDDPD